MIFCKFYSGCHYVGETPQIIDKMTNFWRFVFSSINWWLRTFFGTLIKIRENHWFCKDNMKFFRICVWIWICVLNMWLNNSSYIFIIQRKKKHHMIKTVKVVTLAFCSIYLEFENDDRPSLKDTWPYATMELSDPNPVLVSTSRLMLDGYSYKGDFKYVSGTFLIVFMTKIWEFAFNKMNRWKQFLMT